MATKYFITISPQYRALAPVMLYEQDIYDIRRLLNPCSKYYILYPEFDVNSRLHYHGIIRLDDPIKWHKTKHIMDKTIGFTNIKPIKDHKGHLTVLTYSMKNWANTKQLLQTPIMYKRNRKIKPIDHYLDDQPIQKDILHWFGVKPN